MTEDLRSVIEDAVRTSLSSVPVGKIDITPGWDHADEEAWFVGVEVPPGTPPIGGEKLLAAITNTSEALRAAGDRRFPYILIRYVGEEDADEGEPARASGR